LIFLANEIVVFSTDCTATPNRAFKEWPKMFNNDSTLTSAILDRLLHHAEIVVIEGKSFRMRGQIES